MNKKGFTLIELLAVIVVLALILVLAVPSVLNTMNSAQKKSFQMYGEKILRSAMELYESQRILGDTAIGSKKYNGKICYTFTDLGISSSGSYKGFVTVTPSSSVSTATGYNVYLTDGKYAYNGTTSDDVMNSIDEIKSDDTTLSTVGGLTESCR